METSTPLKPQQDIIRKKLTTVMGDLPRCSNGSEMSLNLSMRPSFINPFDKEDREMEEMDEEES
jgi:hypothetical protein